MRYLFVTHDHRDHFDPQHLIWRSLPFENGALQPITEPFDMAVSIGQMGARHTALPHLDMYGHESVLAALQKNPRFRAENMAHDYSMSFHALSRGETIRLGSLTVTGIVSHHSTPGSVLNYIFSRDGRTLLYALDCGGYDEDIARAIEYINAHFAEPITLEIVADQVHLNMTYLSQMLSRRLGVPFTHYRNALRIRCAKQLIASGCDNMTEVAGKVGFESSSQFSRVFRRYERMSPQQFSKRQHEP